MCSSRARYFGGGYTASGTVSGAWARGTHEMPDFTLLILNLVFQAPAVGRGRERQKMKRIVRNRVRSVQIRQS